MRPLNPDKGSGKPGSLLWHSQFITQCESFEELGDYLHSVTGVSEESFFDAVKDIAITHVKEFIDGKGK